MSLQAPLRKQNAVNAGAKGDFSGEPKGSTPTKTANADVNKKIHQGAVAGNIKATDKPITTGVRNLDEKLIFKSLSPNLTRIIEVRTEIAESKSAENPCLIIAKIKGAESIIT